MQRIPLRRDDATRFCGVRCRDTYYSKFFKNGCEALQDCRMRMSRNWWLGCIECLHAEFLSEHKSTRDTRVRGTEQQSCDCLCELSMERIFEGHNSETTDGAVNGGHNLFEGAKRENFSTIEGLSKEVTGTFIRASTRSGKQKYWFIDVVCHPREFIHRPSISWARCHRRWLLSGLWVM